MTVPTCREYRPKVLWAVSVEKQLWSGGGDWFAEVSTDSAPALLFSKYPAKISIKLPEMLLSSQTPQQGWRRKSAGGGHSAVQGVFLRSQVESYAL